MAVRPWPLWVAFAASGLYLALLAVATGEAEARGTNLLQVAAPALAAAACLAASRRAGAGQRLGWSLAALACASWAVGQVFWTSFEWIGDEVPFPSAADAGYLQAIPLMAAALVLLGPRTGRSTRARILLDGLLTAICLLFVMWVVVLGPMYRQANEGPFALAVALAYPLGDIVMAAVVLNVATRAAPADRLVWACLGLGVAGWALADSGFAYMATIGTYGTGDWIDVGWFGGFLFVAAAGTLAYRQPLQDASSDGLRLTNLGVPWIATAVALTVTIHVQVRDGVLEPFLVWCGLAFVLTILVRQMVSQTEIRRLNDRLMEANRDLAGMLRERERDEATRAELEAARRQALFKTDFLNSAAHELATPMTPIRLVLSVLESDVKRRGDVEEGRNVAILRRNFDRLSHLVSDLLHSARLELGKTKLSTRRTDLAVVAAQAVEDETAHAKHRGITITSESPDGPVVVDVDPRRIAEVASNLVSNAVKFTPTGGRVAVRVGREGDEAVLRVSDTGIGLTAEQRSRLFQPFVEVHSHSSTVQSTGLGLYIAKALVERHGGSLTCESSAPGQGSLFVVRLPLPFDPMPTPAP